MVSFDGQRRTLLLLERNREALSEFHAKHGSCLAVPIKEGPPPRR
jgi:hypothetical protein